MLIDIRQLLTINSFIHVLTLITILGIGIVAYSQLRVARKYKSGVWVRYLPFYHFIGIAVLWVSFSLLNYLTLNPFVSLWGSRLAFAVVPLGFIGAFKLFYTISNLRLEGKVKKRFKVLEKVTKLGSLLVFFLAIFDPYIVTGSTVHKCVGCSDIPHIGPHAIFYLIIILVLFAVLFYEYLYLFKNADSPNIKRRLKIVAITILSSTLIIIILNLILPYIFNFTALMDIGVVSAIVIVLGFYLALENKWVYSLKYLISKHVFVWVIGAILFISLRIFEFLATKLMGYEPLSLFNPNIIVFGALIGILMAYAYLNVIKYSEKLGLWLVYKEFLQFKNSITDILKRAIYSKKPQPSAIKDVLTLIADFLGVKEVCVIDTDPNLIEPYKVCAYNEVDINVDLMTNYIRIPLLKTRFLVINIEDKFISREVVELISNNAVSLNALINLNITDSTLKDINKKLARAVVNRTNKLKKELEDVQSQLSNLSTEYQDCRDMFPSVVGNVSFNAKMAIEYFDEVSKKLPDDFELRFAAGRLREQLFSIKAVLHRIVIFSDAVIRKKVYKQKIDMKKYLRELLDVWEPQFDSKTIGLVRDLVPGKLPIKFDLDKINFVINSAIGYMLAGLRHGYLHVIQRNQPGGAVVQLRAVAQPENFGFSPITDEKMLNTIKTVLKLAEKIVALHEGYVNYDFDNGILRLFEFSIAREDE